MTDLEPSPAGELALTLPVDPFSSFLDDALADLADYVLPHGFPPQISGAAIWDDIWNAVQTLWSFISYPNTLMGWLWDNVVMKLWNRIWDAAQWFWSNAIQPSLQWTYARIWDTWSWFWTNALQPSLQWIYNRLESGISWLWDSALHPFLDSIWLLVDNWFRWLWDSALYPFLNSLWNRVWDVWQSFWNDLLQPSLQWLWSRVWDVWQSFWNDLLQPALKWIYERIAAMAQWVVDNIVLPSWNWLWDNIAARFTDLTVWTGGKFQDLGESIVNVTIQGAQAIGEGFGEALRWFVEHAFDPIADAISTKLSIPRKLLTVQYNSLEEVLDDLEDPITPGHLLAGLQFAIAAPAMVMAFATEAGRILAMPATQEWAKRVGATLPTFTDLRDGYLRKMVPQALHDDVLRRIGFPQNWVNTIRELYFEIPTPSDLVRMAVREAFTPEVIEEFHTLDEFPADFSHWAEQVGISEYWAQRHWIAHWELPSATQGFDMMHRAYPDLVPRVGGGWATVLGEEFQTVIGRETLDLLLRVHDYAPFWRPMMTAIAYRPIHRVDIRRLYATGAGTKRDIIRTYLSLGYHPDDVAKLTTYVMNDAAGVDVNLPRETIMSAYRDRLLTREEAAAQLDELRFTADQVELFLDMADLQVEQQNARLAEDIFEADFKSGAASEAQTRAALAYIGLPEARINLLLELWRRQRAVRTSGLSASQLQRLYHEGLINEATLRERLTTLGYNETDVAYLVQIAAPEAPAEARRLTLAQDREALREGYIDTAEFTARLQEMGYPPEDISILVDLAQPETIVEVQVLSVSQLQRAFRQGIIGEAELRGGLAERGYTAAAIDTLVALSRPEAAVRARELTLSQLQAAFRQGIIAEAGLRSRLLELGYAADAAEILVELARPPEAAQPKGLSVSQLQRALRGGLLTELEVQAQLVALGYSAGAVSTLIALARPEELVKERDLSVAQNQKALREGLIPEEEFRRRLQEMGFSALDTEILLYLALPEVE